MSLPDPLAKLNDTRLLWATDIHMDFLSEEENKFHQFADTVRESGIKHLILAGDIELAPGATPTNLGFLETVKKIQRLTDCRIFFVLGNHDFWGSSIKEARVAAKTANEVEKGPIYLHEAGYVELNPDTALIGIDGWYDGRAGEICRSTLFLRDFEYIEELKVQSEREVFTEEMREKLTSIAKPGVDYVRAVLPEVFKIYKKAVLVTHVPPYWEASTHEGKMATPEAAPFFVSQSLGEALTELMLRHPHHELLVLCGHTHSPAEYSPISNIRVITGKADYYSPGLQPILKI